MPTDTRPQRKGAPAAVARALALALPVALSVAACSSSPQSFVVLDLEHDPTETSVTAIADITTVEVDVSGGTPQAGTTPMRTLDYDARVLDGGSLTIQNPPALGTLSVSFSGGERGSVTFSVSLVDGQSCVVGQGTASTVLRPGGIVELVVFIRTAHNCNQDGGTPDGGEGGVTFPGCDTVDPTAGAPMCSTNPVQTCVVNCAMHKTECALGGAGPPGALCKSNVDCQPGTQCFDYTGLGPGCTGVKVCLRFCASAATCAAVGDGGAGPGSVCEGRVPCGGVDTSYHTCTLPDGPRLRPVRKRRSGGLHLPGRDPDQAGGAALHERRRLRARPALQRHGGDDGLPIDLPVRRERRGLLAELQLLPHPRHALRPGHEQHPLRHLPLTPV
jgi:hypothetical protein